MGNSNAVFLYMALLLMEGSAGMVMIMQQKRSANIYSFPSYGMIPRSLVSQPRPRYLSRCGLKALTVLPLFLNKELGWVEE